MPEDNELVWPGVIAFLCVLLLPCGAAASDQAANERAAALLHQADGSFAAGQYVKAAAELTESLRLNPKQPGAAKALGVCYQILGNLKRAEASFAAAASLDGGDPETWFFLGRVFYLEHLYENARNALQTAARLNARDPLVHELLALTFATIGDTEAALREFTEAVRWNSRIPKPLATPHLSYGVFLHRLNRPEESEKQLRLAAKLNPKDWMSHFELGKLLLDLDRLEAAAQALAVASRAAKPGSEEAVRVYRLLGRTYYRMGREDDARKALAMAAK